MVASEMLPSAPIRKDANGGITIRFLKVIVLIVNGENSFSIVSMPLKRKISTLNRAIAYLNVLINLPLIG